MRLSEYPKHNYWYLCVQTSKRSIPQMMRKHLFLLLNLFVVFIFSKSNGFAQHKPDSIDKKIMLTHKKVAIVPFNVQFLLKKNKEKLSPDAQKKFENEHSELFQSVLTEYLQKRVSKGKYSIEVLDPTITNSLLRKGNIDPFMAHQTLPEDLGKAVQADAVLICRVIVEREESDAVLTLFDCKSNKVLWKVSRKDRDGFRDKPREYVNNFMKRISNDLPYD